MNRPAWFVVDLFAGGGGASEGIRRALGRCPDVAVNHDAHAIAMHEANHPTTEHYHSDVFEVEPCEATGGRQPDLLWASPDCTHFSRAKGGTPRKQEIRGLAWVVTKWAEAVRPKRIILENVPEFRTWGPLGDDGHPVAERAGETFKAWVGRLEELGYVVEWRELVACDFGSPTTRKRLYLVARCDGRPIVWPEPTHGPGRALPWRTAAECIDWSIPCPSIFGRPRPLAEATQRRIAEGIRRYVLTAERPFIAPSGACSAHLLNMSHGGRLEALTEPARTITATPQGGDRALVSAHLIGTRNGERQGQAPRARDIEAPHLTVTSQGSQGAVVAAFLAKHYGGVVGHGVERPLGTVTSIDHHSVVAAHITKFYGTSTGADLAEPAPTVTSGGGRGGGHAGLVAAFLLKFYQQGGQWSALHDPMHTIVTKARMGLVTVTIGGEEYALVDIGLRMLQPHELALAQGFGANYQLPGTKAQQVARIGNSVCPDVAEALVACQFGRAP